MTMLHNIFKDICIYFLITLVATKQTSFISVTDMCPCGLLYYNHKREIHFSPPVNLTKNGKVQDFSK